MALLLGPALFLLLELIARLVGGGPSYGEAAAVLETARNVPLFEKVELEGVDYWRQSPYWFGEGPIFNEKILQYFRVPKPAGVFRILALGESTTAGHPFGPAAAYPQWLEVMLNAGGNRSVEVINCGVNDVNSDGLRNFIPQVLQAQPDLILIYSGHNDCTPYQYYQKTRDVPRVFLALHREFLHSLAYRRLFLQVHNRLREREISQQYYYGELRKTGRRPERDQPFWSAAGRSEARRRYRENLKAIIQAGQAARTPVLFFTVISNLRDYAPEGSVHNKPLTPMDLASWKANFDAGEAAFQKGDYLEALADFQKAAARDDTYALLRYRRGQTLLNLGETAAAKSELTAAVDRDDNPARAFSWVNPTLREETAGPGVFLVDLETELAPTANFGISGDDLILDNVHPSLATHRKIAELTLALVLRQHLLPLSEDALPGAAAAADQYRQSIPPEFLAAGYERLAEWMESIGRVHRARWLYGLALEVSPEDAEVKEGLQELTNRYANMDTSE